MSTEATPLAEAGLEQVMPYKQRGVIPSSSWQRTLYMESLCGLHQKHDIIIRKGGVGFICNIWSKTVHILWNIYIWLVFCQVLNIAFEASAWVLSHFSHAQLSGTLWTVARQAPRSMEFFSKNTGVGCHVLLWGIFLTWGSNLHLLVSCIGRQVLYHQIHLWSL